MKHTYTYSFAAVCCSSFLRLRLFYERDCCFVGCLGRSTEEEASRFPDFSSESTGTRQTPYRLTSPHAMASVGKKTPPPPTFGFCHDSRHVPVRYFLFVHLPPQGRAWAPSPPEGHTPSTCSLAAHPASSKPCPTSSSSPFRELATRH